MINKLLENKMDDLEIQLQIWKELRTFFDVSDVDRAAEVFVNVLIENGVKAEDVTEYAVDDSIILALQEFIEIEEIEYDDDDTEEYET